MSRASRGGHIKWVDTLFDPKEHDDGNRQEIRSPSPEVRIQTGSQEVRPGRQESPPPHHRQESRSGQESRAAKKAAPAKEKTALAKKAAPVKKAAPAKKAPAKKAPAKKTALPKRPP